MGIYMIASVLFFIVYFYMNIIGGLLELLEVGK